MKSGLFLHALHPKLSFKKTLSCNIRPRHFTQSSSHSIRLRACYKYARFTQHTLVRNCVRCQQKNNFTNSSIVRVKIIKISSCRWWRFLTATSAIELASWRCIYLLPTLTGEEEKQEEMWTFKWDLTVVVSYFLLIFAGRLWSITFQAHPLLLPSRTLAASSWSGHIN